MRNRGERDRRGERKDRTMEEGMKYGKRGGREEWLEGRQGRWKRRQI
jgi:hypothetical protein